jgi:hypothetical protein
MPYVSDMEWDAWESKNEDLEEEIEKIKDLLHNIKGAPPIIQASHGKRFDLNDNLDVIILLKRISDIENRLTILETP